MASRLLFLNLKRDSPPSGSKTSIGNNAPWSRAPNGYAIIKMELLRKYSTKAQNNDKLFDKILIANRGEIACRVMRTAKRLGIKTVAVHSEPDAESLHVKMADEAVCVGPAPTAQSYLNIPAIMDAIRKTKAQAVHPGYGFLSENMKFAEALEKEGVTFIGPNSHAIYAMGDKIESKKLAQKAGVNIIPGRLVEIENPEDVIAVAKEIGYPVMIKASAGGGGKGMRIAWNDQEAREGFRLAKQEAKASFGDDRILIEKFIDNPRHIEIQIMGDGQGTTLYCNERECSIQRRNQKVLEEAPSSFIDPATRKAMGEQAVALANAVGYKSAGTVEFLVDPQRNFYFLEMNTRLQVEHPITEYITGFDLVEMMIRVAAGQRLNIKQKDVPLRGWAMEARVYAEDPLRNFLPSIGTLDRYVEPVDETGEGNVRVDSGVREGDPIQVFYDPLISKLVTYGQDRQEAIDRMARALDTYVIRGLNHNIPFLRTMMEHPKYRSGDISTKFIPQEFPEGFKGHPLTPQNVNELIASAAIIQYMRESRDFTVSSTVHKVLRDFPPFGGYAITFKDKQYLVGVEIRSDEELDMIESLDNDPEKIIGTIAVRIVDQETGELVTIGTEADWPVDSPIFRLITQDREATLQYIQRLPGGGYRLQYFGTQFDLTVRTLAQEKYSKFMPVKQKTDTTKFLASPMPGRVLSVSVKPGDKVVIGQELVIVEAMKMQNVLRAQRDCTVKQVNIKPGQDVAVDQLLIEFD